MDSKKSERIVAYLDGELNDHEVADVDRLLSDDVDTRQQVEQYSRAWEMLDLLPSNEASEAFAERTLTAIQSGMADKIDVANNDPVDATAEPGLASLSRRILIRTVAVIGLFLVAVFGFNSSFRKDAEPIDELLRDLPMLERLDQYHEAQNVEFLQELDRSGVLNDSH